MYPMFSAAPTIESEMKQSERGTPVETSGDAQKRLGLVCERVDIRSAILRPEGELELFTAKQFQERADELAADGVSRIVVDLSQVSFIDSAGVSALIRLYRRAKGSSSVLCLAGPGERCREALEIAQLNRFIPVYPSVEAALAETGS
jgi:anti-sigma B factor antagonist